MTHDPNAALPSEGGINAQSTAAPGWYDDGAGRLRWWDGAQWTLDYRDYEQQGAGRSVGPEAGTVPAEENVPADAEGTAVLATADPRVTGSSTLAPAPGQKRKRTVPLLAMILSSGGALVLGLIIGGVAAGANGTRATTELTAAQENVAELQAEIAGYDAELQAAEDRAKDLQAAVAEREDELAELEADLAQREEAVKKREDAVTATETEIEENKIPGSGIFLVGTDIKPGTYRSVDNSFCYWARLSGVSGDLSDIIANGNVEGQAVVQISGSDKAFESTGCSEWSKIG